MRRPMRKLTQKQLDTTMNSDGLETVSCPFCDGLAIGSWAGDWLQGLDYCNHFTGYVMADRGKPSAKFVGYLPEGEGVE